jgi:hypothetical protein
VTQTEGTPVASNPFTEQTAGRYFVGREEQLRHFELALRGLRASQPPHFYVAGVHGTGKTSYLAKLVELSREQGVLAVLPTLDATVSAQHHINTVVRSVVDGIDAETSAASSNALNLAEDWAKGSESKHFRSVRSDRVMADDLRADLAFLQQAASQAGWPNIAICVDEGQRIDAFALSTLKNAVQQLDNYLIVLSIRLIDDQAGAVGAGRIVLDEKAREAEGDFGASRFFVAGVGVGQFENYQEAQACIERRLDGNTLAFSDDVTDLISYVTDRVPGAIIALAWQVYYEAASHNSTEASLDTFKVAFKARYGQQYRDAVKLVGEISETSKTVLRALSEFDRSVRMGELVAHMYPELPDSTQNMIRAAIASELDQLCQSVFCTKEDDQFIIPEAVRRYALRAALELE